jgi:hypothetical protein
VTDFSLSVWAVMGVFMTAGAAGALRVVGHIITREKAVHDLRVRVMELHAEVETMKASSRRDRPDTVEVVGEAQDEEEHQVPVVKKKAA